MTDEIKEYPVQDMPGWVRIVDGGNRRYRMPNGETISNAQFHKMKTGQNILPQFASSKYNPPIGSPRIGSPVIDSTATPGDATPIAEEYEEEDESHILPPPTRTKFSGTRKTPGITKGMASRAAGGPHLNQQQRQSTTPSPEPDVQQPLNLPDPKSHPSKSGRRPENGATSKELADGLYITLSIVTSIVAMFTIPDLAMGDVEAKSISIPAGNLLEPTELNKRFGRMIAASGDWQLLGYAMWLYIERVKDPVVNRIKGASQQQQTQYAQQQAPVQSNGNGNYNPAIYGAALRPSGGSKPFTRQGGGI